MSASASTGSKNISLISISVALLFLIAFPTFGEAGILSSLKETLFPNVQVTLYNDLDNPVIYMCGFNRVNDQLHQLGSKNQTTFFFNQIGFPLRWCYLYITNRTSGFFWAYGVRLRCNKCFWRISDHLYLYRSDRNRWERQTLYSPRIRLTTDMASGSESEDANT